VGVQVNAEGVTAIHREPPVFTALLPLGTVPPLYKPRHPFQLFIRRRQMQQSVSLIDIVLQHSLIISSL
jgi:hypothetical protein